MENSPNLARVKEELLEHSSRVNNNNNDLEPVFVDLTSSDSDSDDSDSDSSSSDDNDEVAGIKRSRGTEQFLFKKRSKSNGSGVVLPPGFLDPLPNRKVARPSLAVVPAKAVNGNGNGALVVKEAGKAKQFWKAGDYEVAGVGNEWEKSTGGMDHVRVHPRFLHSNATSHKWVLGAFAELLDNSLDEAVNGATCVNIDMIVSKKDGSRMLLVEDNGGGMDPDKMRQCMSLGYSLKSKVANTIGQYGNGFKTSTMRLGADVIVFSRCSAKNGKRATQSIGLLSYTFLRSTGKEDIVVPMLDYERVGTDWNKIIRSSAADWNRNVETILQWSPFSSEMELFRQFNQMTDQGTRIIIYNLWEDDQGSLELDFDSEIHDIQIRGVNRDEKNIRMAQQHPNSRHFLTYRHSLRSYASILYLRIPHGFRIILRGKDVEHHNIVNDMMMTEAHTYRPISTAKGAPKDPNNSVDVEVGFVKDAKAHIDVQGFNVYHKNRLIKPFWRVWNAAGSDGRGVIGVLEANFVEPAHDKQGFERTTVLSRLEKKLVELQKEYWSKNCFRIGYAARRNKQVLEDGDTSPDEYRPQKSSKPPKNSSKTPVSGSGKYSGNRSQKHGGKEAQRVEKTVDKSYGGNHKNINGSGARVGARSGKEQTCVEPTSPSVEDMSADNMQTPTPERQVKGDSQKELLSKKSLRNGDPITPPTHAEHTVAEQISSSGGRGVQINTPVQSKWQGDDTSGNGDSSSNIGSRIIDQLKEENRELKDRLREMEVEISRNMHELQSERNRCTSLEVKLEEAMKNIEEINAHEESVMASFSEERERRDAEEEKLRKKVKEASQTIQELLDKVRVLEEKTKSSK